MYTTPALGKYRVHLTAHVETVGTAGTLGCWLSIPDTAGTATPGITSVNMAYVTGPSSETFEVTIPSGKAIQYNTSVSGATGSPTYGLDATVERLQ
jgi:hypothetical protein